MHVQYFDKNKMQIAHEPSQLIREAASQPLGVCWISLANHLQPQPEHWISCNAMYLRM